MSSARCVARDEQDFDIKLKNSFVELRCFTNEQWRVKMAEIVQYEGAVSGD